MRGAVYSSIGRSLTYSQRGVSYQIGSDGDVRGQFLNKGYLTGEIDTNFRAVRDRW